LKNKVLKELKANTEGSFIKWLEQNKKNIKKCKQDDIIILDHMLSDSNFMLVVSSKALLLNAIRQQRTGNSYLAVDATHKIISCHFKFSTFATSIINQQIADIAYMVHMDEDSQSYIFGLKTIQKFLEKCFKEKWQPQIKFFFIILTCISLLCRTLLLH